MSETYEEIVIHRYEVYPVDDELIFLLGKIGYQHVVAVLKPILDEKGYEIEKTDFQWIKFSEDCLTVKDFRSPRTDNLHAVYLLNVSKGCREDLAIYQPFSHKVYLVDCDEITIVENPLGQNVQFALRYYCMKCPLSAYTTVRRTSRCFKVRKRWFKDEKVLIAAKDRMVSKLILNLFGKAEDLFYDRAATDEVIIHHKSMYYLRND